MRYALAALMGLVALGGVQARTLPSVDNALGKRAPEIDFTHLSDYPLDDPRNDGLAKRVAAGGTPPTRPSSNGKPGNRNRPGRPNANEDPDGVAMAIELVDLSDTSDIVKARPCGAAKRSFEERDFNAPFDKRMSGDDKALTWEEWQSVFDEVDQELTRQTDVKLSKKVKIIFMGGISGIAFGSRGEGGKTGDADFSFHVDTPESFREALRKAVDRMVEKNPGKFETIARIGKPDPMNDQWDKHSTQESKNYLSSHSRLTAWEGNTFTGIHGDWKMQLISKMNRISEWRARSTEFKEKDQKDAQFFLQKVKELMGNEELSMENFVSWGEMIGMDRGQTEALVAVSIKIVAGDDMPGIAQEVKDRANKIKC